MKKTLLLFILMSAAFINAQTVTVTSLPKAGDWLLFNSIDTPDVNTIIVGTAGTNKVWNFSALKFKNAFFSPDNYEAPSAAILSVLPTASYVLNGYVYEINVNGLYEIGEETPITKYPKKNIITPINLTNGFIKKDTSLLFGDTSSVFYVTNTVEHSGTLTTKKGTFPNVLVQHYRIESKINYTLGGSRGKFVVNRYIWQKPDYRGRIFDYAETSRLDSITGNLVLLFKSAVALVSSNITATTDLEINNISSIYPNPAKSQLNINIKAPKAEKVNIAIVDITGKELQQQNQNLTEGIQTIALDINTLNEGGYFLVMKDANGTTIGNSVFIKE
jgi:Secretion system C-terminal sorting domain